MLSLLDPNCEKRQLVKMCLTRWTSAGSATSTLVELFPTVIRSLEITINWSDPVTSKKSFELLCKLKTIEFLTNLLTIDKILALVNPLTVLLQKKSQNLGSAYEHIEILIETLSKIEARGHYTRIFEKAEQMAIELDIHVKHNRAFDRQSSINHFAEVYNNIVKYFIDDLRSRTSKSEKAFVCLEKLILGNTSDKDSLQLIVAKYKKLFNMTDEKAMNTLAAEAEILKGLIKKRGGSCDLEEVIQVTLPCLPMTSSLLRIFASNPPSVSSAERSFSCLKRLKTWLRANMGQARTSGLALMQLEPNYLPTIDQIIVEFCKKDRRNDILL